MYTTKKTPETLEGLAIDALNAGFPSKSAQKDALSHVTYAYEAIRRELMEACLASRTEVETGDRDRSRALDMSDELSAVYWDVPSYPHQFKAKHEDLIRAAFGDRFDARIADISRLVELRETIKSAEVVPPAKDETKALAARVVESIKARMDRLGTRYLEAIDLCTVFPEFVSIRGLSATAHYVTNEHGTTFLRTFYYLNGKLTPLNLILAAAEEKAREAGK